MALHYKMMIDKIRQLRTEAETLQEELNEDIESMIEAGLVASPTDEEPVKAVAKYVRDKLEPEAVISAAEVKRAVPSARDLTHRGITVLLTYQPLLIALGSKDQYGLKQFKRQHTAVADGE